MNNIFIIEWERADGTKRINRFPVSAVSNHLENLIEWGCKNIVVRQATDEDLKDLNYR